jgi:hypothetical protein
LHEDVVTIRINYLLQSPNPVEKNGCDDVACQIPSSFPDGLDNIVQINEKFSPEFSFELAEEEKVG